MQCCDVTLRVEVATVPLERMWHERKGVRSQVKKITRMHEMHREEQCVFITLKPSCVLGLIFISTVSFIRPCYIQVIIS